MRRTFPSNNRVDREQRTLRTWHTKTRHSKSTKVSVHYNSMLKKTVRRIVGHKEIVVTSEKPETPEVFCVYWNSSHGNKLKPPCNHLFW
ncbi:hypothetical protein CSKR_200915 [Clonorchis sinensis]|nr:hypothetical protein CSKR_200915 [Clonorchis sinensis]